MENGLIFWWREWLGAWLVSARFGWGQMVVPFGWLWFGLNMIDFWLMTMMVMMMAAAKGCEEDA